MLEWLHGLTFNLRNELNIPTREDSGGHTSTIDLIFTNEAIINTGILSHIYINTEIGSLSDHHAITFTTFCNAIKEEIEQNGEEHTKTVREVLNQDRNTTSESKLDEAVKMIQKYLEQAATKTVPTRHIVSRLKPWWTKELTTAYKELRNSREVLKVS